MSERSAAGPRRLAAALSLLVMPALLAVLWLMWGADLPEQVPTHFDGSGTADQYVDTSRYSLTVAIILAAATITGLLVIARRWLGQRFWIGLIGMLQGFLVSAWVASAVVGRSGTDDLGGWIALILVSAAWGAVPALLHPPSDPDTPATDGEIDATVQAAPWSDTSSSPLIAVTAAVTGIVLVILLVLTPSEGAVMLLVAVPLALVVVLLIGLAAYRVAIDERGVRITSVHLGFPLRTFDMKDIARASSAELHPVRWGGWGWRFLPGRSAIVTRRGPALVIEKTSGSEFSISLPTADEAAAVLRAYLASRPDRR